jgi:hypothetical protein
MKVRAQSQMLHTVQEVFYSAGVQGRLDTRVNFFIESLFRFRELLHVFTTTLTESQCYALQFCGACPLGLLNAHRSTEAAEVHERLATVHDILSEFF